MMKTVMIPSCDVALPSLEMLGVGFAHSCRFRRLGRGDDGSTTLRKAGQHPDYKKKISVPRCTIM